MTKGKLNILDNIIPGLIYDNGFIIDGKTQPYYSFCTPMHEDSWSNEISESLRDAPKTLFIDIMDRKIALDGIKETFSKGNPNYIDCGCGLGYMLQDVIDKFPNVHVFGADYFNAGLMRCHHRLPHIPLFQDDLVNSSFGDSTFDVITCLNVLEHIEDDEKALRQLFRILKPRGIIMITVPASPGLYDMYDEAFFHKRRYELDELKKKVVEAGFNIMDYNYFGTFMYPLFFMVKKLNRVLYSKLSVNEKRNQAFRYIKYGIRLKLFMNILQMEMCIGKKFKFPFGIRAYIRACKVKI